MTVRLKLMSHSDSSASNPPTGNLLKSAVGFVRCRLFGFFLLFRVAPSIAETAKCYSITGDWDSWLQLAREGWIFYLFFVVRPGHIFSDSATGVNFPVLCKLSNCLNGLFKEKISSV